MQIPKMIMDIYIYLCSSAESIHAKSWSKIEFIYTFISKYIYVYMRVCLYVELLLLLL